MILIKGECRIPVFWTTETITQEPEVLHIFVKFAWWVTFLVFWNTTLSVENMLMKHTVVEISSFCSITFKNLGKFSKPGSVSKSAGSDNFKHPLHVQFDQVLAEIFEVKDTRYHSFIFLRFSLIEMKVTDIWTFWSKNCSVHHKRHQYQQEC